MIRLLIASVSSVIACSALAAEVTAGSNDPPYTPVGQVSALSESSDGRRICDTTYVGPSGGAWQLQVNWTNGLPRPGDVACFPEDHGRVGSLNPPHWTGVITRVIGGSNDPPLAVWTYPNPPAPTAWGSCCLGSTCMETDAFDCRELGGYFLEGVGPCTELVCATGACCIQDAECLDDGGDMDESLCDIMNGHYLGGAVCENDPCQRFRIPKGFEIVEVTPGMEALEHWYPRLNNCGQIVFDLWLDAASLATTEIFHYDNGLLTQITDNNIKETFPDINDEGAIVWLRWSESPSTAELVMLEKEWVTVIDEGGFGSPSINNLGHVAWSVRTSGSCDPSAYRCDIYFYDGNVVKEIWDDGYSNQSARINDRDQIAWTRYNFPCGGGFEDWTSEIMLYSTGGGTVLPSSSETPQIPDVDNQVRVAWDGSPHGLEVWQDGVTTTLVEANTACPGLNDRGDVAYQFKTTYTPWYLWLYRKDQFVRISNDLDIENLIDNGRADINDAGEIAWWWKPNGAFVPSGTRFMRRIRNGDVDFDGDVDLGDFIPMPGCFTGPVTTDGLCECRFFDIDHDRDIDYDDFDLFMRVYTGPLEDCNENSTLDLRDLLDGTCYDCNLNGVPDSCDIASGFSPDGDGDGVPDECCSPATPDDGDTLGAKNRYLSFTSSDPGQVQAVRVTFTDLPAGFEALVGQTMWVGQPEALTENSGKRYPSQAPGWPTFMAAMLQCDPYYTDWSKFDTVYVYHQAIVPGGTYELAVINDRCTTANEGNYSAPLAVSTSMWGDVVENCTVTPCLPPDGSVGVTTDVTAILDKFKNDPGALIKVRADIEPALLDHKINITDVSRALDAFRGWSYPFASPEPCP